MYDVIVVGSGGAGLSAALWAKRNIEKILIISKTYPTHSQTCQAQGGINAVLKTTENDTIENFTKDTIKASKNLSNPKHIKQLCEESENTIKWLDQIGVPFSYNESENIAQRKFGGTKAQRTCYSSDYTGLKILHTLYDQCIKENIDILSEHKLLDIDIEKNIAEGITVLDIQKGIVKKLKAKTVILATGGYAGLYDKKTTNSSATTGDGIYAAFKAGAKLSNMEFIQFHPTTLEKTNTLVSESARGEGGYLIDESGNRFIDELKSRDEVSRAIYEKVLKNEKVYLDMRHIEESKLNEIIPQEIRLVRDFLNLDMNKDLIPITPSAHYSMGGILVDINGETTIKNLYACGECAQSQVHGANRLGGNSLLEIVTFGKSTGISAAKNSLKINSKDTNKTIIQESIDKKFEKIFKNEPINFYEKKEYLGKLLFEKVGLFRDEKKLLYAKKEIEKLKFEIEDIGITDKSKIYNQNLCELLEYKTGVNLALLIVVSALNRKESRGAHFRNDYNTEVKEFEKNSTVILENGKTKFYFEDVI